MIFNFNLCLALTPLIELKTSQVNLNLTQSSEKKNQIGLYNVLFG